MNKSTSDEIPPLPNIAPQILLGTVAASTFKIDDLKGTKLSLFFSENMNELLDACAKPK